MGDLSIIAQAMTCGLMLAFLGKGQALAAIAD
jgi:hypothetical protein